MNTLDWDNITDLDTQNLNTKEATFIAGSRTISAKRILELAKKYILKGNVIWGYLQDAYIEGFEDQPHFRTLELEKLQAVIEQFEKLNLHHSFTILKYNQSDLPAILETIAISKAVFINASWKIAFHRRPEFPILERKGIEPKLISPFINEDEAIAYSIKIADKVHDLATIEPRVNYSDEGCIQLAHTSSKRSFDYTWQTGSVLSKEGYVLLLGHNRILPYETYMWHTGSLKEHGIGKEKELSQMHNLNNNDTLHAEMDILIQALNRGIDLEGTTLYVSLMPCPNCARAIAASKIHRVVYEQEHFGGLAEDILTKAGKEVMRLR